MIETKKTDTLFPMATVLLGLPLLFWALGDFPQRTVLKEFLSLTTLVAFSFMLGLFCLTRGARQNITSLAMPTLVKFHKIVGYLVVSVLLFHPLFIVIPRYFESGVSPSEAFVTMVTTWESQGVVLGLIAWCLMLILGATSLLRNKLPMTYKSWRLCHGLLAILFVVMATWHAIDLGRHMNRPMSIYFIVVAAGGILLLLKIYILKPSKDRKEV